MPCHALGGHGAAHCWKALVTTVKKEYRHVCTHALDMPSVMADAMAYRVMVNIVMAYIVMAYTVIAYIVIAYSVMAYIVMACKVMAYIVLA